MVSLRGAHAAMASTSKPSWQKRADIADGTCQELLPMVVATGIYLPVEDAHLESPPPRSTSSRVSKSRLLFCGESYAGIFGRPENQANVIDKYTPKIPFERAREAHPRQKVRSLLDRITTPQEPEERGESPCS